MYEYLKNLFYGKGDYKKEQILGIGSFGNVWLVTDKKTGQKFALKQSNNDLGAILYQYDLLGQVNKRLPGSLKRIKLTEQNQFIMEYLEGYETLNSFINTCKNMDTLQEIFYRILDQIDELHRYGISHRDLKANNIMIHPETLDIKIIDFGLACLDKPSQQKFSCKNYYGTTQQFYPDYNSLKSFQDWAKADKKAFLSSMKFYKKFDKIIDKELKKISRKK
jgi:serine/threonine-protein kinase